MNDMTLRGKVAGEIKNNCTMWCPYRIYSCQEPGNIFSLSYLGCSKSSHQSLYQVLNRRGADFFKKMPTNPSLQWRSRETGKEWDRPVNQKWLARCCWAITPSTPIRMISSDECCICSFIIIVNFQDSCFCQDAGNSWLTNSCSKVEIANRSLPPPHSKKHSSSTNPGGHQLQETALPWCR